MSNEIIEIYFDELKKETDMAWLVKIDEDEVWLPKSVCELDEKDGVAEVPEWICFEKELI